MMQNYDSTNIISIFEYSAGLINHRLRDFWVDGMPVRAGKGGFGQMVEEIFFHYHPNSNPGPDFEEAGLELKCTGLKEGHNHQLLIKERLVCGMIDYCEVINETFDKSHFYTKCRLMLILFYLYVKGQDYLDYEFLYRVLWQLPEKDLEIIRRDYETIVEKVRRGEAHLLSEGDTEYLAACTKGQNGNDRRCQPRSPILAKSRAFSLKPSYMRTILEYVQKSGKDNACNFDLQEATSIVSLGELCDKGFEEAILCRIRPYIGFNYCQISDSLGLKYSIAKSKYALISHRMVSDKIGNINESDEFRKSGITMKTVRVQKKGTIKESMSFENIDYCEVADCEYWEDSRLYEIFTSRFLFVVYRETDDIIVLSNGKEEPSYVLDKAFFWTMPVEDLDDAELYWLDIKDKIAKNEIHLGSFYKLSDNKKFHVRPKAKDKESNFLTAINPNGGTCERLCYWFNASYVRNIIETQNR